tara:strand:+ start:5749 stop:5985 length:237 start_codon:yes stop_codon:yes gene_type:complete
MYQIQNNIPIPDTFTPRNNKYDFHKMGVGDCIERCYEAVEAQRMRVAASNYATRNNKKFTSRKVLKDDKTLFRLWRVA